MSPGLNGRDTRTSITHPGWILACLILLNSLYVNADTLGKTVEPVIDVHIHALPLDFFGKPPVRICSESMVFLPRDGRADFSVDDVSQCQNKLISPSSDESNRNHVSRVLRHNGITGVITGPLSEITKWRNITSKNGIPAAMVFAPGEPSVNELKEAIIDGQVEIIGEVMTQYAGISIDDQAMDPYFSLAEEMDVPIAVHMGLGAPAAAYVGQSGYRAELSNPLLLEPVLLKYPKLRVYVMHAGWPMLDEMIHLMYSHPQVYVDTGIISYGIPRKEFYYYLKRLVEAGFGKRIMFGSDQMIWPEAIEEAVTAIKEAPFLSEAEKRDILYNNAARFLKLTKTN